MANVTITKTGNSIIVDFGDYFASDDVDYSKSSYDCRNIADVNYIADGLTVRMNGSNRMKPWKLTWDAAYTGDEYFIIDSVETVAPTSQTDLFDKITALRG